MRSVFSFFLLFFCCYAAQATDYYVAPDGNDGNSGLSSSTAWQTLAKVSGTTFQPGDRILLKAGGIWSGQLSPKGSGLSGSPIIVDMYGTGDKPVINAPGTDWSAGFSLTDQSYWEVSNLEITNRSTVAKARLCGVQVQCTNDNAGLTHVYIQNCFVHNVEAYTTESDASIFSKSSGGIIFTGYTNEILVKGCHIKDVSVEGIRNSSDPKLCSHIVVDSNLLENIYGDGIVFHGAKDNSAITRNVGRNLCYNTNSYNYAGMWTYLSQGTLVAYNEVSGITGGGTNDGQAFDADISTNGDIFEYNYTHDNRRGFMLFMPSTSNIIVRYNISVNDIGNGNRLFNYTNTSANSSNKIYNNIFYIDGNVSKLFESGFTGEFSNNIIYCTGTVSSFSNKAVNGTSRFYNNCFYPQSMTNTNGPAGTVVGNIYDNPMFANAGYHADGLNSALISAYSLADGSPCINTGKNITNNGGLDFAGTNIQNATYSSIGAIWPTPTSFTITTTDSTEILTTGDAYTYDASKGTNYGTAASLVAKFGGGYAPEGTVTANNYCRRTYLMFPSYAIDTATKISRVYVRMRYWTKDAGGYSTVGTMISLSSKSTWNENTITWNNQDTEGGTLDSLGYTLSDMLPRANGTPPNNTIPTDSAQITDSTHYVYLDVTDTILAMKANNTLPANLSFVLQGISTASGSAIGNTGFSFFSKDFKNTNGQSVDSLMPTLLITASTSTVVLPVKTSPLTAAVVNGSVQLKWTTYTEANASKFVMERSSDGKNFVALSTISAKGNSSQSVAYLVEDKDPLEGLNYYRWKETDLDGKVQYSNIVKINFTRDNSGHITVYPNPVKAGTSLTLVIDNPVNDEVTIRLTDMAGRTVKTVTQSVNAGNHKITLPTTGLAKGIYIVAVTGSKITRSAKVIVY